MKPLLGKLGYSVVGTADTGNEALQMAEQFRADLVLMDIRIIGPIDGVSSADLIRKRLHVPVVFLTSHADPQTVVRAGKAEPFGYIVKPFEEHELHAAIEIALVRAQAEDHLRKMERWLATTLDSIGDAVIATDLNGRVTYCNPVAEALTGWSAYQAVGLPFDSVFEAVQGTGAEEIRVPDIAAKALSEGMTFSLGENTHLITRDGVRRAVEDSAAPIRDESGKMTGAVVVFRDCSRRIEAEESRRRIEERMRQTQKLESLGLIAGGVAHDFNNILTAIIGHAQLIQADVEPGSKAETSVQQVLKAATRASALCKQMNAYAGKCSAPPVPVDLNQIAAETLALAQAFVSKRTILAKELAQNLPAAQGDATQFQQIVLNLLINASEALPNGEGTVTLRTLESSSDNPVLTKAIVAPNQAILNYVCLEVEDNGCGIPADSIGKIFDPFYSTKFSGRGLGLAAVMGIVRSHGGTIQVDSIVGKGSTFRVFLPRSSGVLRPPATKARTGAGKAWKGSGSILLVEDEPAVRSVTKSILSLIGFEVIECESGRAALEAFKENGQAIVACVIDVTMPDLSGIEVLERLRVTSKVPVLLVSGYSQYTLADIVKQHPFSSFLPKPFSKDELQQQLRQLIEST